jgi:hypothetical protein
MLAAGFSFIVFLNTCPFPPQPKLAFFFRG